MPENYTLEIKGTLKKCFLGGKSIIIKHEYIFTRILDARNHIRV